MSDLPIDLPRLPSGAPSNITELVGECDPTTFHSGSMVDEIEGELALAALGGECKIFDCLAKGYDSLQDRVVTNPTTFTLIALRNILAGGDIRNGISLPEAKVDTPGYWQAIRSRKLVDRAELYVKVDPHGVECNWPKSPLEVNRARIAYIAARDVVGALIGITPEAARFLDAECMARLAKSLGSGSGHPGPDLLGYVYQRALVKDVENHPNVVPAVIALRERICKESRVFIQFTNNTFTHSALEYYRAA